MQTDATLLPSNKTKTVGTSSWYFPSRADCVRCHTSAAGRTLGLELGQLNGDFAYAATNRIANQLKTFEHIGLLDKPLGKEPSNVVSYPDPLGSAALDSRARSYLHANCSHCHRPGSATRSDLDLRFATSLRDTNACGVASKLDDLGDPGAKLIVPGAPQSSLLSLRARALGVNRMPPLAINKVDTAGMAVIDGWIGSLSPCP